MKIEEMMKTEDILIFSEPKLIDSYPQKIKDNELFRIIYIYNIGTFDGIEMHVYMMVIKEHNSLARSYNLDSDCTWLMDKEDNERFYELSDNMISSMKKYAIEQLEKDYLK